jgi:hypothetical protein
LHSQNIRDEGRQSGAMIVRRGDDFSRFAASAGKCAVRFLQSGRRAPSHIAQARDPSGRGEEVSDAKLDINAARPIPLAMPIAHDGARQAMRLLDRVAQSTRPVLLAPDRSPHQPIEVTGPRHYARPLANCPLRYVLNDDLTHAAAQLAFADGDRLADCIDLVRIPATRLWVEWSDEVHQRVIVATGAATSFDARACGRQVGVYLEATPCGRTGVARTFWSERSAASLEEASLSPIETHIRLAQASAPADGARDLLGGGFVRLADRCDPALDTLLDCLRFRLDERWISYYQAAADTPDCRRAVTEGSLSAVARDMPLLFAFFLLLLARDATAHTVIGRGAVNAKRARHARPALLDHIEVRSSLERVNERDADASVHLERRAPRLHHVRGHLVRRGCCIFWRSPHLRGRAAYGAIHSRTVCLDLRARPVTASRGPRDAPAQPQAV